MRRALLALAALVALHEVLAWALDRADLIERLLSPSPAALLALPFALLLYAVRLTLVFVAPGLVILALARYPQTEGTQPSSSAQK